MRRAVLAALLLATVGCEQDSGGAYAHRVSSANDLIGGPGAIATIGDWAIGNGKIRIILQDQGWSRGFGLFGGGIIDADLNRTGAFGTRDGGTGKDNFGEFFPALFVQAFDVQDIATRDPETGESITLPAIEVMADGSDGGDAIIRARARGGDFITMLALLLDIAIPSDQLRFETDYIVRPGVRHVEIVSRMVNTGVNPIDLPLEGILSFMASFGIDELPLPVGDVALFGAGNTVFAPGAVARSGREVKPVGFDLRFSVEASYEIEHEGAPNPGRVRLPGLVTDFIATAGEDVSYGFAVADSDSNYVWDNREFYEMDPEVKATRHSMLVPFLISSFTGAYYDLPPSTLEAGEVYDYTRYFIVGDGDIGSIRDEIYRLRGEGTGTLRGRVVNARSGQPEAEAEVHILDNNGQPYSHLQTDADGRFSCRLAPGHYRYRVTAPGRRPFPKPSDVPATEFEISLECDEQGDEVLHPDLEGELQTCVELEFGAADLFIQLPAPAEVSVRVRDAQGRALPAKVSLVTRWERELHGQDPRDFLYDLSLKEHTRHSDLSWLDESPTDDNRQFIEEVLYSANGIAEGVVRPSCHDDVCRDYDIVVSRGPEYDLWTIEGVRLEPGVRREFDAVLTRVVDTTDWISADLHLHAVGSPDSSLPLIDRVTSAAAEGLEMPVATDHNYVTDYAPIIAGLGLGDWLTSVVGVELSTLEQGHYNAFPLRNEIGSPTHFPYVATCEPRNGDKVNETSFDWVQCLPGETFDNARSLGRFGPQNTIVQINHPRDTILGYFNQYFVNPWTVEPGPPDADNHPEAILYFAGRPGHSLNQFAPESFSWNFDAIEVFNGKRLDMLHGFRIPDDTPADVIAALQDPCQDGHPDNGLDDDDRGKLRLRKGGHIAYPGAVDDWMRMLNRGFTFTATGNSDSHRLGAEIGSPRTYVWVQPQEDGTPRDWPPGGVTELDLVDALHAHRAIATNGPFLDMTVVTDRAGEAGEPSDDKLAWPMGSTVKYASSNVGRQVEVLFNLRSSPWIDIDEIVVYANGEILERIPIQQGTYETGDCAGRAYDDCDLIKRSGPTYTFDRDVVLVAEAIGSNSLFPVVAPKEEPPTNLGDLLAGLGGGLGLDTSSFSSGDGVTAPTYIQRVTPYALTNPIWLDIDASGEWDAPGNPPGPARAVDPAIGCPEVSEIVARPGKRVVREIFKAPKHGGRVYPRADIRKIFHGHHPH